jgi:hypothetical protein
MILISYTAITGLEAPNDRGEIRPTFLFGAARNLPYRDDTRQRRRRRPSFPATAQNDFRQLSCLGVSVRYFGKCCSYNEFFEFGVADRVCRREEEGREVEKSRPKPEATVASPCINDHVYDHSCKFKHNDISINDTRYILTAKAKEQVLCILYIYNKIAL